MSGPGSASRWSDPRGNPSRWVALLLATLLGIGLVTAAILDAGYHVVVVLAFVFLACFDAAFGRRPVAVQLASILARRPPGRGT